MCHTRKLGFIRFLGGRDPKTLNLNCTIKETITDSDFLHFGVSTEGSDSGIK